MHSYLSAIHQQAKTVFFVSFGDSMAEAMPAASTVTCSSSMYRSISRCSLFPDIAPDNGVLRQWRVFLSPRVSDGVS